MNSDLLIIQDFKGLSGTYRVSQPTEPISLLHSYSPTLSLSAIWLGELPSDSFFILAWISGSLSSMKTGCSTSLTVLFT